jgi:hypothetical protein
MTGKKKLMEQWLEREAAAEQERRDRARRAAEKNIDGDWLPNTLSRGGMAQTIKGSLFDDSGMMIGPYEIARDARQGMLERARNPKGAKAKATDPDRPHSAADELQARVFIELHKKELIPDRKMAALLARGFDLAALGASDEQVARAWEALDY